jgi:hypothetical protein
MRKLLLLGGLLAACEPQLPAAPPRPAAELAALMGLYEGTVGAGYAVRLALGDVMNDTLMVGQYYYLSEGRMLELRGHQQADTLTLRVHCYGYGRTYNLEASHPVTAVLRLAPTAGAGLAGTWQTVHGSRRRVQLRRLRNSPAGAAMAQVGFRTEFGEFKVPVLTVPDLAVSRVLRQQLTADDLLGISPFYLAQLHATHQRGAPGDYRGPRNYRIPHNANGLLSFSFQDEFYSQTPGARVTRRTRYHTFDLHTGFALRISNELRPTRRAAFMALCDSLLRRQLWDYLRTHPGLAAADRTGLLNQTVNEYSLAGPQLSLDAGRVRLPYQVQYDGMSHTLFNAYEGAFVIELPVAWLLPFVRPDSPLRRLPVSRPR